MISKALARRVAVLAASFGATAAVGSAPALAAVPGENVFGSGSSLQKLAQVNIWTTTWFKTPADHSTLSNNPKATYTATSSGAGLAEFGNTTGVLDPTQDATADNGSTNGYGKPVLDAYVGSDDPPTGPVTTAGTNLADASLAATGHATAKIDELTVPVGQAPVAILISLPKGITAGSGSQVRLANKLLQEVYDANVPASAHYAAKTWGALLEDSGWTRVTGTPGANQFKDAGGSTGGTQAITLQVRSSASGTTYTLKGFLNLSGDPHYPSRFVNDNDQWPVATVNTGNTGGSQEVADTTAHPGSIGYANLADAASASPAYTHTVVTTTTGGSHQIAYAILQANYRGTGTVYADPEAGTGTANVYTGNNININGGNATFVGHWRVPLSGSTFIPTGTWAGTQASDPDVYDHSLLNGHKTAYYPIVAVTYDLAWTDYDEAASNLVSKYGGSTAQATAAGNTANSLITYIVNPSTGQTDLINGHFYYAKLPSKIDGYSTSAAKAITP
jgi:hypothetical protein